LSPVQKTGDVHKLYGIDVRRSVQVSHIPISLNANTQMSL